MSVSIGGGGSYTPPPLLPVNPNPPLYTDPSVQAAALAQQKASANAAGRASTILTSGEGDTSTASIGRKTLLGS